MKLFGHSITLGLYLCVGVGVLLASFGLEDLETEFKWGMLLKATFRKDSIVEGALESEDLYSSFISVVN